MYVWSQLVFLVLGMINFFIKLLQMLIQLNKDPLFVVDQSPIKLIKEKEVQRMKQRRDQRVNPSNRKKSIEIEVINPFPKELQQYKDELSINHTVESSKASQSLKRYVIQQQRNLRCLRLDRISFDDKLESSRLKSLTLNMSEIQQTDKNGKDIDIPRIQDLFKNQSKEILIHENKTLREKLSKMMHKLDEGIKQFKTIAYGGPKEEEPPLYQSLKVNNSSNQEDYEIDKIIEKKLLKSKNLRDRLYNQKKEMGGSAPGESNKPSKANNMSYFLRQVEKPKKRYEMKGVRALSYQDGARKLKLTPASILLFEMSKLSKQKDRNQSQLTGLLKNSYQNRDTILKEKQQFYQSENPFCELNTSQQFQLRKVMNKKLNHRLEISKEQVNKFTNYLYQIKNYQVILNQAILDVLKEVRETLMRGKVMKISDLKRILDGRNPEELKGETNELVIKTLTEMMI